MKIKLIKHFLFVMLVYSFQGCTVTSPTQGDANYQQSDYIFEGEVIKAQESNLDFIKKSEKTFVVKVIKVILASEGHENFEGNEITVVIDNDKIENPKTGVGYIFYTQTWLFGKTLAVRANELDPEVDKLAEVKKNLAEYQQKKETDLLKRRIDNAELVFVGKVMETRQIEEMPTTKETEHEPNWNIAIVEIQNLLKGKSEGTTIQVYFSGSTDVHWYKAPKLKQENAGIFLISHSDRYPDLKSAFLLTDPGDFLEESKLDAVKKIIDNQ